MDNPSMSTQEQAIMELDEEAGVTKGSISRIKVGAPFMAPDKAVGKTWIVYTVAAVLCNEPAIKLNSENVDYAWIKPCDICKYDVVPDLDSAARRALDMF
ncbi:MAG: hypothetical protein ACREBH_01740 [Candidatus Micrarchaeaceae archaeon]